MTRRWAAATVLVAVVLAACGGDDADTDTDAASDTTTGAVGIGEAVTTTPEPEELYPDHTGDLYAGTTNWICHPDLADDPCRDLRTTVLAPDGTSTVDDLTPATDPAFDCFYAYPTTSTDQAVNSDLTADSSEIDTVRAQVARYASVCRVFAPVYRSITLGALVGSTGTPEARELAYGDVADAWRTYADEFADGRGVVLIGHSQGAGHLARLIQDDIVTRPDVLDRVISALILGAGVPEDELGIPNCTAADDVGCLISFASFAADQPPGDTAIFGRTFDRSAPAACVDPVALAGGNGLGDTVLPANHSLLGGIEAFVGLSTPFVALPGAVRTECVSTPDRNYLAVSLSGVEDARPLDDLLTHRLGPDWGLHLLDANLVQDDLIEVVARQAEAYADG